MKINHKIKKIIHKLNQNQKIKLEIFKMKLKLLN